MVKIGSFEAKTHFSSLLDRVVNGEEITITKHGRPVARLVSAKPLETLSPGDAFQKLKDVRRATTLGGISWKDFRDEVRKSEPDRRPTYYPSPEPTSYPPTMRLIPRTCLTQGRNLGNEGQSPCWSRTPGWRERQSYLETASWS